MSTPNETHAPAEPVEKINISATFDPAMKVWTVACPEWKCTLHTKNLTRTVTMLIAEIETHNEGGEPDWNTFAAREGLAKLRPHHHPKKQPSRYNYAPIPDDGTRTPNRRFL